MYPDRREVLIDLFDREFVEAQEAHGMCVLGQFRDVDEADAFVWLRGFADMIDRHAALSGFYGGPVWKAHKDETNATMLDSDDVLLLRPVSPTTAFTTLAGSRPPIGPTESPPALFTATIFSVPPGATQAAVRFLEDEVEPLLMQLGSRRVGLLRTEIAPNTFRALPVREGENVIVRLARFDGVQHFTEHRSQVADSRFWVREMEPRLRNYLNRDPLELRLRPTSRSLMR